MSVKISREIQNLDIFADNAELFLVEYEGDIQSAAASLPNVKVIPVDSNRVILSIVGNAQSVLQLLSTYIVGVAPNLPYTPCISPVEAANADLFHNTNTPYLQLDGRGTIVGIVDSGVDYLNEEFINEDGTSRILYYFDQETGREYTRENLNAAIQAKREGRDPYSIVPLRDNSGHGTNLAGIAGARGVNPEVIGVAPRCEFMVYALKVADDRFKQEYGILGQTNVYTTINVILGIKYIYEKALSLNIPTTILFSLASNLGPKNGLSTLERYIDQTSNFQVISVVIAAGNQGDTETHTSGKINFLGDYKDIELNIDRNQRNIKFEIWIEKPDIFSISIISPTNEIIQKIPAVTNKTTNVSFLFEGTKMEITFSVPERQTGDELITIRATGITEGIWKFRLIGDFVSVGRYDAYLISRELLATNTRFLNADPYVTLSTPSTALDGITVGAYNQNNNSIIGYSSRGYTRDGSIKPDIAAGGINALTTAVGGGTQTISGTSVAAAVVAGCYSLIYQWAIVDGYDKTVSSNKIKTYLVRGAAKREGDTYPNRQWGYGTVDMKGVFDNIRYLSRNFRKYKEYYIGNLFVRLP